MVAAQRAREIVAGAPLTLDRDDDKNPVVALREIADETVDLEHLQDSIVQGLQKHVEMDEAEEEPVEFDLSGMTIGADGPEAGLANEALAAGSDEAGDGFEVGAGEDVEEAEETDETEGDGSEDETA